VVGAGHRAGRRGGDAAGGPGLCAEAAGGAPGTGAALAGVDREHSTPARHYSLCKRRVTAMPKTKNMGIDLTPPAEVASAAEKGLALRRKYKRGGTNVGVARARDLKGRKSLSTQTIKRMVYFFQRHEVDKQAENFGNEDDPSA